MTSPSCLTHYMLASLHAVRTFQATGGTYAVVSGDRDWPTAMQACNDLGMCLASLTSAALLTDVHTRANIQYSYWVGGSDANNGGTEGSWFWPGRRQFWPGGYANWASGEPNGGTNENCLLVYPNGQWNDQPCSTKWPTLCGPGKTGSTI